MRRRLKIPSGAPHPCGNPISPNSELLSKWNGERSILDGYLLHCRRGDTVRVQNFERLMTEAIEKASRPVVHDAM